MEEEIREEWLIGIRLRDSAPADDYKLVEDVAPSVGDIVMVETATGTALGEVRRPRRPLPDFKRDRLFRRVVRAATATEEREYRDRRSREERAVVTARPVPDSRLLGNCGRLKCCLLYEFSTYQELRARLPRVNTPCQADCGGGGCMTGKVRSIRVLAQSVIVGFPDGSEAEVPLEQLTWEGRSHVESQLKQP